MKPRMLITKQLMIYLFSSYFSRTSLSHSISHESMAIAAVRLCHNFKTATDRIFPLNIIITQEYQSQLEAGKTLLVKSFI